MSSSVSRPRGRPRKRLTRMDAAVDAMRGYGFSDRLIVSTVRELLEVYGEAGWPFIEESSYKVLLEAILEHVEKEEQEKSNTLQENEKCGNNIKIPVSNNTEIAAIDTSNGASTSTCHSIEAVAPAYRNRISGVLHSKSQAAILDTALPDGNNAHSPAPKGGSSWKDVNLDQNCMKEQINNDNRMTILNLGGVQLPGNTSLPTQPTNCLPARRRRPCYGWISSDDEEDLIELTPAPLPTGLAKLLSGTDMLRTRKRRWDARPEDM